jgi:alpha-glucosidase
MHNVEAQRADPGSMLHLTRRLLELRRSISALRTGSQDVLELVDDVLAFRRTDATGDCLVLINLVAEPRGVEVAASWNVRLASDGAGEGEAFTGRLAPDQAVVLVATES